MSWVGEGVFWEDGSPPRPKLDAHGHEWSRKLPGGAVAGVLARPGGWRVVLSRDGNPAAGYDGVWWYEDFAAAVDALTAWRYPGEPGPPGHVRDLVRSPLALSEMEDAA